VPELLARPLRYLNCRRKLSHAGETDELDHKFPRKMFEWTNGQEGRGGGSFLPAFG